MIVDEWTSETPSTTLQVTEHMVRHLAAADGQLPFTLTLTPLQSLSSEPLLIPKAKGTSATTAASAAARASLAGGTPILRASASSVLDASGLLVGDSSACFRITDSGEGLDANGCLSPELEAILDSFELVMKVRGGHH